ncbi:YIEGIA family protein [Polycladomyces subterraneus]|uniref:YIEGIA family protein n=1 Tax=Polycladomyces subterraneus TaxID=1016997 RepID=A0ABT8IN19_9BACL|nr:YIEGIA family protein [Polycladomyces subterraneus]MDN4594203.1 YIEGIA family protein [Polycladomyces subterraneus]
MIKGLMHLMHLDLYTWAVIIGVLAGFATRMLLLRTDYRQYPTYPHGHVIHLSLGLIAAGMGAVAVPALLDRNYTAITFLALAAQQFREVRNMERETMSKLDHMELVPRGASYIEGIAMVFEGRNYLVIFSSFITSLAVVIIHHWYGGVIAGLVMIFVASRLRTGRFLREIAEIRLGTLRWEGANLFVDDIHLMNVGLKKDRERIGQHGVGVVVQPLSADSVITLANMGQRQAILHDVSATLGVYRDTGEAGLVPIAKRKLEDGRLGILVLPQEKDEHKIIDAVGRVPVLESAVRMPTETLHHINSSDRRGWS